MKGTHHVATGIGSLGLVSIVLLWIGSGPALLLADPRITILCAVVFTAHHLRPDIDHDRAIATRTLGWVSRAECEFWQELSRRYYTATRAPGDEVTPRAHRGFTHTPVGAVTFGALVALQAGASQALCAALAPSLAPGLLRWASEPVGPVGGGWALAGAIATYLGHLVAGVLALGLRAGAAYPVGAVALLGYCALLLASAYAWRDRWFWALGGVVLGAALAPSVISGWPFLGLAAALGCYGHCLGDACTTSGCALRHPFTTTVKTRRGLARARWEEVGLPRWLRFPTGSRREEFWVSAFLLAVLGVLVIYLGARAGLWDPATLFAIGPAR